LTSLFGLDDPMRQYKGQQLPYDGLRESGIPLDTPLVVGNPDFSNCGNFMQLSGAEQEAQYAATTLKTNLIRGKQATKKEILGRVRQSEFIYLATHAVADEQHPLDSGYIVLAGEDGCTRWTAREIQNDTFKKQALVILSACQTGLGKALDAGIVGVCRSFIRGGAGNVVMSLWSVDDKTTGELMHLFIDELKIPHRFFPADNLRAAIIKYKAINPDPAAWAPFTIMGTPFPMDMRLYLEVKGPIYHGAKNILLLKTSWPYPVHIVPTYDSRVWLCYNIK
jgi:CHAT domain-containing protein